MEDSVFYENLGRKMREESKPFWDALSKESDRSIAIISACLLDNLLEKLICASYIKDPRVKSLFKNAQILQPFFTKINIAYFSGLIPKIHYHDLVLVCEIRNKFAHTVTSDLSLNDGIIAQKIDRCELRPKTMDYTPAYGIKFILIIQQLVAHLCFFEHLLLHRKPLNLIESFNLGDKNWGKATLAKDQIYDIIRKNINKKESS